MKLIITEKPSVAQAYAKVLGVRNRQDGYLEGSGYIVSWCVGHLVELSEPEEYDSRYGKWRYGDLPILPEQWGYRVMTPTLAMVVMREAAIRSFVPEPFYTVQLAADQLQIGGERMKERTQAEEIVEKCRTAGTLTVTKVEQKERSEKPPLPYDLTGLQRDANRILGYTAQQTLDYAQALYEGKLITYPRTDSKYLTNDMGDMLPGLLQHIGAEFVIALDSELCIDRILNSSGVSDHHAILPTVTVTKKLIAELPAGQREILRLIATRLCCSVGQPYRFAETTVEAECAGSTFKTKSKTVASRGWKQLWEAAYPPKKEKKEDYIPELKEGAVLTLSGVTLKEGQTTSPAHFTEDSLLQMMETAGAEAMPENAERRGIGTPATRAGIIEKLVQKGFVERVGDKKNRHLISTAKGDALITVVPEQIQSPSLTADWEEKLLQVEHRQYDGGQFMSEIGDMVSGLVGSNELANEPGFVIEMRLEKISISCCTEPS